MSKTGEYVFGRVEEIAKTTGYNDTFLTAMYFSLLSEAEQGTLSPDIDILVELERRGNEKVWGDPEKLNKIVMARIGPCPAAVLFAKVSTNTGYDLAFLAVKYIELLDSGDSPDEAFTQVEAVSYEQDW